MQRSAPALTLVIAVVLLCSGCAIRGGGGGGGGGSVVAPQARLIPADGTCSVQGDLEGRFGESRMYDYLACVVPLVDGWIDAVYSDMPHPAAYVFIPEGGRSESGCGPVTDEDFEYCGADQRVYLGAAFTWRLYSTTGDASAAFGIAHEVTHHFQHVMGVSDYLDRTYGDRAADPRAHIQEENQADCGGGAFMDYENRQGDLNVADDIGDIDEVMPQLASAESATRDHGTLSERVASFNVGWTSADAQPLAICDRFFPAYPLVQ